MQRLLAKAAQHIPPSPLAADEAARLSQLEQEAFDAYMAVSAMMNTLHRAAQRSEPTWKAPEWELWERLYRTSNHLSKRYRRRCAAREAFKAQHAA